MRENEPKLIMEEFKRHLESDGKSPSAVESYVGDVTGFVAYLEEKEVVFKGELKRIHVTSYRKHLVEGGFEVATINKKVNSLQSFNGFLMDSGYTREQVIDLRKDNVKVAAGSEREVEVLKDPELGRLLYHVQDPRKASARDRLMVALLLYTGVDKGTVLLSSIHYT